jgi:hypothetical protein
MKTLKKTLIILLIGIFLLIFFSYTNLLSIIIEYWYISIIPIIIFFILDTGILKDLKDIKVENKVSKKPVKPYVYFLIVFAVIICFSTLNNKSKSNTNNNSNYNPQPQTNPCEDMDSYNKGLQYGRLQRGGLPDCDTYYYEGAANNKDCWCQGFMEGRK